jgi:hypothetical protein
MIQPMQRHIGAANQEQHMSKPTITRTGPGVYHFTGWVGNNLVQYSILLIKGEWQLARVYGNGPTFHASFPTKRAAVAALASA